MAVQEKVSVLDRICSKLFPWKSEQKESGKSRQHERKHNSKEHASDSAVELDARSTQQPGLRQGRGAQHQPDTFHHDVPEEQLRSRKTQARGDITTHQSDDCARLDLTNTSRGPTKLLAQPKAPQTQLTTATNKASFEHPLQHGDMDTKYSTKANTQPFSRNELPAERRLNERGPPSPRYTERKTSKFAPLPNLSGTSSVGRADGSFQVQPSAVTASYSRELYQPPSSQRMQRQDSLQKLNEKPYKRTKHSGRKGLIDDHSDEAELFERGKELSTDEIAIVDDCMSKPNVPGASLPVQARPPVKVADVPNPLASDLSRAAPEFERDSLEAEAKSTFVTELYRTTENSVSDESAGSNAQYNQKTRIDTIDSSAAASTAPEENDKHVISTNAAVIANTKQVLETSMVRLREHMAATNDRERLQPSRHPQTRADESPRAVFGSHQPVTGSDTTFDDLSQLLPSSQNVDSEPGASPNGWNAADEQQLGQDIPVLSQLVQMPTKLEILEQREPVSTFEGMVDRAVKVEAVEKLEPAPREPTNFLQEWLESKEINLAKALLEPLRLRNVTSAEALLELHEDQLAELSSGLKPLEKKRFVRGLEALKKVQAEAFTVPAIDSHISLRESCKEDEDEDEADAPSVPSGGPEGSCLKVDERVLMAAEEHASLSELQRQIDFRNMAMDGLNEVLSELEPHQRAVKVRLECSREKHVIHLKRLRKLVKEAKQRGETVVDARDGPSSCGEKQRRGRCCSLRFDYPIARYCDDPPEHNSWQHLPGPLCYPGQSASHYGDRDYSSCHKYHSGRVGDRNRYQDSDPYASHSHDNASAAGQSCSNRKNNKKRNNNKKKNKH